MKVPKFLYRYICKCHSKNCHSMAFKICCIGQDWEPEIQKHLNHAKDELYKASKAFEEKRNNI